jgi:hypothetical protein
MPIIHGQISKSGPIAKILIGVSGPRRQLLEKHGFLVPPRKEIRAVLDTGSAVTGLPARVFRDLDLQAIDQISIFTPSTGATPHECNRYHVSLSIAHDDLELHLPGIYVIETEFWDNPDYQGLIGRDFLDECLLVYDGPRQGYSLGF